MTFDDFRAGLERELRLRAVSFDLGDLLEFASATHRLAEGDGLTNFCFWANEFTNTSQLEAPRD